MLFPTLSFAAFFIVVLPVSWILMPHRSAWRPFMVAASWFFYGAADWRFVPLLAGSTVVNHLFARQIYRTSGARRKKAWTTGAVVTNLAVLGWFKYVGFLSLSGQSILRFLGMGAHVPLPEVILPVGISFFTFQALSYVIDTGRGKVQPVSLLDFAVYLSFFPHLVAGPIVRASEFLPQIRERIGPRVDLGKAFWLISAGLFKKVVIASYLGTYAADPLFGFPHQHAGVEALFGVYAYAIQIYADFSGYTDIAIGLALLLGIRFPQNFNAPYSASSLQDFWRRWHMTLSRWLRDYLYIPLGGNRRGRRRTYINVMITMLLGGLWHGAAWTFVAWGALHGGGLVVERWWHERRQPATPVPATTTDAAATDAATTDAAGPPRPARVLPGLGASLRRRWSAVAGRRQKTEAPAWPGLPITTGNGASPAPEPAATAASAATAQPEPAATASAAPYGPRHLASTSGVRPVSTAVVQRSGPPPAPDPPAPPAPPPTDATPPPPEAATPPPTTRQIWVGRLITFHFVCLAWIFFRANSFHNAMEVIGRILALGGSHRPFNWKVAAVVVAALAIQCGPRGFAGKIQAAYARAPMWLQGLAFATVLSVIDLLGPAGVSPFIYFRF